MARTLTDARTRDEIAAERLAFADAALGAAGHEIADPFLNELARQQARGEISGETARERARKHVIGR